MTRTTLKAACLVWLLACSGSRVAANDIENFFRGLRGGSGPRHSEVPVVPVSDHHGMHDRSAMHDRSGRNFQGGGHGRGGVSDLSSRDTYKIQQRIAENYYDGRGHGRGAGYQHSGMDRDRYQLRDDYRHDRHFGNQPVAIGGRSGTRISFSFGGGGHHSAYRGGYDPGYQVPVTPVYQQPVLPYVPAQPPMVIMPHELGEIVTCPVPLATCIRVEDPEKIAPNSVPVVVAVRDPNLPPHASGCVEQLVYVEVCVPSCPMQKLVISPCKTRIQMDFGHHQVDIRSCHGEIVIDYDN